MRKAQISLEFLVYSSIFLLVFIIMSFVFSGMAGAETGKSNFVMATILGNKLLAYMSTSYYMGPDFTAEFELPANINGFSYDIMIVKGTNSVFVNVHDTAETFYSTRAMYFGLDEDVTLLPSKKVVVGMRRDGLCVSQDGDCQ